MAQQLGIAGSRLLCVIIYRFLRPSFLFYFKPLDAVAISKSDDNSKFNEYLSSLVPVDIEKEYDNATVSDSESDDSDDEEAGP